jgi:hypothetical protein
MPACDGLTDCFLIFFLDEDAGISEMATVMRHWQKPEKPYKVGKTKNQPSPKCFVALLHAVNGSLNGQRTIHLES